MVFYYQKEFKKRNLKVEAKIKEAELSHVVSENYWKKYHNKVHSILLEKKAKDANKKSSKHPKRAIKDVCAELMQQGEKHCQNCTSSWDDIKITIETQK